jgi:hypothetical protein
MTEGFGLEMSGSACGSAVALIVLVSEKSGPGGILGEKPHQRTPISYKTQPPPATFAAVTRHDGQSVPILRDNLSK